MTTFANDYFSIIDQAHEGMVGVGSQINQEKLLPEVLSDWFASLWHVIRATEPTLQNCVDRLESYEDDAFTQSLRAYYEHKLVDEADHGAWLLDDVEHVGMRGARAQWWRLAWVVCLGLVLSGCLYVPPGYGEPEGRVALTAKEGRLKSAASRSRGSSLASTVRASNGSV
jgi:hypothetical protein